MFIRIAYEKLKRLFWKIIICLFDRSAYPYLKSYPLNFRDLLVLFSTQGPKQEKKIIFLIFSAAEERILSPVLKNLSGNSNNYIALTNRDLLFRKIKIIKNPRFSDVYLLAKQYPTSSVINCLDFQLYYHFHKTGCDLISFFNKKRLNTFCLQHGGIKTSNIEGQISSNSKKIMVWGTFMKEKLIENKIDENRILITGNPLHDNMNYDTEINCESYILIATCLHSEYELCGMGKENYDLFILTLKEALKKIKCKVFVKMHPLDREIDKYKDMLKLHDNYLILKPYDEPNIYTLLQNASLVITRASTIAEEALLQNKKVILFDVVKNGPACEYQHLTKYPACKMVISTNSCLLQKEILDSLEIKSVTNTEILQKQLSTFYNKNNSCNTVLNHLYNSCSLF